MKSIYVSFIWASLGATVAVQADQYCHGTIVSVFMDSNGAVAIQGSWRGDFTTLCSDQGTFGNIDGTTCLAWFGAAVKAQASQSQVVVYYAENQGHSCLDLPTYASSLPPSYLMITQ